MIPELNQSGVLPPFIPEQSPTDRAGMAPYHSSISEFILRYAKSKIRIDILKGLLSYRKKLREIGITEGFQWVDGSFVENVETNLGRPPNDIDIVTFAFRPTETDVNWSKLVTENSDLFFPEQSKKKYICDAYFVDLSTHPVHVVNNTKYWFGLFSHQRETYLWKGMIEIPIMSDDDEAIKILEQEIGDA